MRAVVDGRNGNMLANSVTRKSYDRVEARGSPLRGLHFQEAARLRRFVAFKTNGIPSFYTYNVIKRRQGLQEL